LIVSQFRLERRGTLSAMAKSGPWLQAAWSYGLEHYEEQLSSPAFPTLLAVAVYFFANIPLMVIDLAALDWSQVMPPLCSMVVSYPSVPVLLLM
jgi:hypothetical protein